jgi:hypothetical protein
MEKLPIFDLLATGNILEHAFALPEKASFATNRPRGRWRPCRLPLPSAVFKGSTRWPDRVDPLILSSALGMDRKGQPEIG